MVFTTVVSHENRYLWEVECMLQNIVNVKYEYPVHILVFYPYNVPLNPNYIKLESKFKSNKKIAFFYYKGTKKLQDDIDRIQYSALMRPYTLHQHFTQFPKLEEKSIWYTDSDIVYTRKINFEKFLNDDINYLSLTGRREGDKTYNNYLDLQYFEDKNKQIEEKVDVLDTLTKLVGISKDIVKENDEGTGGAQYLLKNINADFWLSVYNASITIRSYLQLCNQLLFKGQTPEEKENNGFQSFCADMWALLWTIWKRGAKTSCPPELDFAWSVDLKKSLKECNILHNAGVVANKMKVNDENVTLFYKSEKPFQEGSKTPHMMIDYLYEVDDRFCSSYYVKCLLDVENPVKI